MVKSLLLSTIFMEKLLKAALVQKKTAIYEETPKPLFLTSSNNPDDLFYSDAGDLQYG